MTKHPLFPDPAAPPSRMDCLSMGEDCARHGLVGCIIANNGTPPEEQARNFLLSLHNATFHRLAGRPGDFTADDLREWMAKLTEWHKTNVVPMPPPIMGHPFTGAPRPAPRVDHAAEQARLVAEATAMAERAGGTTH